MTPANKQIDPRLITHADCGPMLSATFLHLDRVPAVRDGYLQDTPRAEVAIALRADGSGWDLLVDFNSGWVCIGADDFAAIDALGGMDDGNSTPTVEGRTAKGTRHMSDQNDPTQSGMLPSVPLQPVVRFLDGFIWRRIDALDNAVLRWRRLGKYRRWWEPRHAPLRLLRAALVYAWMPFYRRAKTDWQIHESNTWARRREGLEMLRKWAGMIREMGGKNESLQELADYLVERAAAAARTEDDVMLYASLHTGDYDMTLEDVRLELLSGVSSDPDEVVLVDEDEHGWTTRALCDQLGLELTDGGDGYWTVTDAEAGR